MYYHRRASPLATRLVALLYQSEESTDYVVGSLWCLQQYMLGYACLCSLQLLVIPLPEVMRVRTYALIERVVNVTYAVDSLVKVALLSVAIFAYCSHLLHKVVERRV